MIAPPPIRDPWGSQAWQAWLQSVYRDSIPLAGPTTGRPTTGLRAGLAYFDTSLSKPVWYSGSAWVDSTGAPS